jgi:hypothetical protein
MGAGRGGGCGCCCIIIAPRAPASGEQGPSGVHVAQRRGEMQRWQPTTPTRHALSTFSGYHMVSRCAGAKTVKPHLPDCPSVSVKPSTIPSSDRTPYRSASLKPSSLVAAAASRAVTIGATCAAATVPGTTGAKVGDTHNLLQGTAKSQQLRTWTQNIALTHT